MAAHDLIAVVPLKDPQQAKRRLAPLLSLAERMALALAMAEDVLGALIAARGLSDIVILAHAGAARGLAARMGVSLLPEPADRGINAAIKHAARKLACGNEGLLVVAGDVPLISSAEVEAVLAAHAAGPAVTLVPATNDRGTNGLMCSPSNAIQPQFGADSFLRHRNAALAAGLEPRVVALSGWGHDIDLPRDLATLVAAPRATRTHAFVAERRIGARLGSVARSSGDLHEHVR